MANHALRLFDSDEPVFEQDHELVQYYEGEYRNGMRLTTFSLIPSLDYWHRSLVMQRGDKVRRTNTRTSGRRMTREPR